MVKVEKQEVAEYKVLTPVKHNNKIHRKGKDKDTILKFTEAEAAPLLRHKAIEKMTPKSTEAAS